MPVPKCEKGQILRKSYDAVRKETGTEYHVKATCIKDLGKPGKTPKSKRIPLDEEGDLDKYGYTHVKKMKADERHSALKKAIAGLSAEKKLSEHDSAVKVMRRLNVLMVLNKNTHKTLSLYLERDRNWVGRTYLGADYARD